MHVGQGSISRKDQIRGIFFMSLANSPSPVHLFCLRRASKGAVVAMVDDAAGAAHGVGCAWRNEALLTSQSGNSADWQRCSEHPTSERDWLEEGKRENRRQSGKEEDKNGKNKDTTRRKRKKTPRKKRKRANHAGRGEMLASDMEYRTHDHYWPSRDAEMDRSDEPER